MFAIILLFSYVALINDFNCVLRMWRLEGALTAGTLTISCAWGEDATAAKQCASSKFEVQEA